VILDEAGMVDHQRMDVLIDLIARSGAKLIAVGDGVAGLAMIVAARFVPASCRSTSGLLCAASSCAISRSSSADRCDSSHAAPPSLDREHREASGLELFLHSTPTATPCPIATLRDPSWPLGPAVASL
jgi:hypothetical protein